MKSTPQLKLMLLAAALGVSANVTAALTDISQTPLASSGSNLVKPNIMYVLDRSGSMQWTHAPDEAQPFFDGVGYKTSQCNSIYYDPNTTYVPPRAYDGTVFPNATFTAACVDGFYTYDGNSCSGSANVKDLSSGFQAYTCAASGSNPCSTGNGGTAASPNTTTFGPDPTGPDTAQQAYYYVYTGTQKAVDNTGNNFQNTNSTFYKECNAAENKQGPTTTITFTGCTDTIINQITVAGQNLMSSATAHSADAQQLAQLTASAVNLNGFTAVATTSGTACPNTSSTGVVTITWPTTQRVSGITPVITSTPPFTYATLTFSGTGDTSVTSIKVNGNEITSPPATPSTTTSGAAANTAAIVNQLGYSATASGSVTTLQGPYTGTYAAFNPSNYTPVVTWKGDQKATITFTGSAWTAVSSIKVNGAEVMTGTSTPSNVNTTVATNVAAKIGLGFTATVGTGSSANVVSIIQAAPGSTASGSPTVTTIAGAPTATLSFSGSGSTIVTQVLVNGTTNILAAPTAASASSTAVASAVQAGIGSGYTATVSGSTVTITGPPSALGFAVTATTTAGNVTGTLTVGGSGTTAVTQVVVNGTTITSASTGNQTSTTNLASAIASKINLAGIFSASVSGSTVNLTGPASYATKTPVATRSPTTAMTVAASVLTASSPMSSTGSTFAQAGALMSAATTSFAEAAKMNIAASKFPAEGVMAAAIQPFPPFYRVQVNSSSGPGGTDETQNFANWFQYYRTRLLMMKSGLGRAFVGIGSNYRVGFMTIDIDPSDSGDTVFPNWVPVSDFTTGTATATSCSSSVFKCYWFRSIYKQKPSGGTPLKTALSNGARYLGGRFKSNVGDPGQYSCQQNFILLSTDGYWNAGNLGQNYTGSDIKTDLDGNAPRPQYDKNAATGTLADVAYYYYNTDMRQGTVGSAACTTGVSGADMCTDNVPVSGADNNPAQHVTLFTLGLGTNGQLRYSSDYLTGGSIDYNAILSGTGTEWPIPVGDKLTTIDDLWHAAVNGHGQYFSAKNPNDLVAGLTTALATVSARLAAGAAAATSNLEPVAGDNFAFIASYTTKEWTGDLQSRTINLTSGAIGTTANWSAQTVLDGNTTDVSDTRTIYFNSGTASSPVLSSFVPGNFSATQKSNWFTPSVSPALSQYSGWSAAQQTNGTPDSLINYLRGQWGNEERSTNATASQLYRTRTHVLGDIIDGKPVYMRLPPFNYGDSGYSTFKTSSTVTSRTGTVYVGANDGMLHAFDSGTGQEIWAFVPTAVLPNLKSLADDGYSSNHKYYVDGSPVVTDIYNGSAWKTILVSGLGAGGKSFFAIDVTTPTTPTLLWEYTDTNLGFSFGNPVIGKLTNGTWVVAFTSGYNNVGDGVGRLYVLNAWTGVQLFTISTGQGSATSPSGLNKIAAWVDNGLVDNTIQRIYGGDQFGNLWRFDPNDQYLPAGKDALQLAFFQVGTYQQPITTSPELALVNGSVPMVYVGTGRYIGASDVSDLNQQSLYAIVDKLTGTGIGNARSETTCPLVVQSLTVIDTNTRTTSALAVDLTTTCGWYLDFNPGNTTPGERVNVDPKLQLGVLAVATNIPDTSVCTVGGSSFLYFFDYATGRFVSTSTNNVAGTRIANALAVGVNTYQLPSGQVVSTVTTSDDQHPTFGNPSNPNVADIGKRVMWRELLN